jgi:nicotinate-nucleotide adenylyltransferase
MRVGLLGGSFDPAHAAHAHVAETALTRLGLDRVIWLVSPQNPLKTGRAAPLAERMAGVRKLARGPRMVVSDFESRIGARYTLDTVRALQARFPGVHFVWLMGADNLAGFHRWRGWREIFHRLPIAVIARPGLALKGRLSLAAQRFRHARKPQSAARTLALSPPPAWLYLTAPLSSLSSTALRAAAGRDS